MESTTSSEGNIEREDINSRIIILSTESNNVNIGKEQNVKPVNSITQGMMNPSLIKEGYNPASLMTPQGNFPVPNVPFMQMAFQNAMVCILDLILVLLTFIENASDNF